MLLHHQPIITHCQIGGFVERENHQFSMTENLSFDNYIADLHENLDRLREVSDVDEQSSAIIADLAQAYSEQPSAMQTGDDQKLAR